MANVGIIILGIILAVQAGLAFKQPFRKGGKYRIIDGETAKKGQFPHQAAITLDDRYFCGGALISKSWVLTAGHCVNSFKKWSVVLGAHNIKDPSEDGRIVIVSNKGILHERYRWERSLNNIGVVFLPKDVTLNDQINIIPLPPLSFKDKNLEGAVVRVSGWGKTTDCKYTRRSYTAEMKECFPPDYKRNFISENSDTLQFVDLKIAARSVCKYYYGEILPPNIYCCVGEGHKSTCNGDSGGALTIGAGKNLTHLGIVSFGSTEGCEFGYPTGFTATPAFVEWISNKTGISVPSF